MRRKLRYGFQILLTYFKKPLWALTGVRMTGRQILSAKTSLITEEKGRIALASQNNIEAGTLIKAVGGTVKVNGCFINRNCTIVAMDEIVVENGVTIGPNVCIYDHDHNMAYLSDKNLSPYFTKPVRICKGAWIGANAVIVKGVTVGKAAVVAAGAVVTKDVPDGAVVGGIPACVIGSTKCKLCD